MLSIILGPLFLVRASAVQTTLCGHKSDFHLTLPLGLPNAHTTKSPCGNINEFCLLRGDQKILAGFYNGGL